MSRRRENWVDRLEPPEWQIARVLRHFLALDPERDAAAEAEYSHAIVQMVAAAASEGLVANYLAYLQEQRGQAITPPPERRYVAIAVWHIAKVALVRDAGRQEQAAAGSDRAATSDVIPLSAWLRERLERGADPA